MRWIDSFTAAAKIQPIELQNQQAVPIRSLTFLPIDRRPPWTATILGHELKINDHH